MPICIETLWQEISAHKKGETVIRAESISAKLDHLISMCDDFLQREDVSGFAPLSFALSSQGPIDIEHLLRRSPHIGITEEIDRLSSLFDTSQAVTLNIAFKDFRSLKMFIPFNTEEDDFL